MVIHVTQTGKTGYALPDPSGVPAFRNFYIYLRYLFIVLNTTKKICDF
ncbi:Uncharacterized protein dnm_067690 [Desulfonema magnum]|uniref:Uncharacterized protein n=1 Tax=Desulfonema magnum TaxID=45655 RepID=A0A975BSP6_9BACT|nr:Uncharacterized protein dnm_067690 [Desulfonema magnum]